MRIRRANIGLITVIAVLMASSVMVGGCNKSSSPSIPPSGGSGPQACDGSAAADQVNLTVVGNCTVSISSAGCPAGSSPPNTVSPCSFTINNLRAASVDVAGNSNPVSPIINSVMTTVPPSTGMSIPLTVVCSSSATAQGNFDVVVTDPPSGDVLCQSSVPYDITVTP
jgi:hypothetical protein